MPSNFKLHPRTHKHANTQTLTHTKSCTHTLTDSQLCSTRVDITQNISDKTCEVPLILLNHIHHSQSGSGGTTVLVIINQVLSIPLPLVGEVTAYGLYHECNGCPWNYILLTHWISSNFRTFWSERGRRTTS